MSVLPRSQALILSIVIEAYLCINLHWYSVRKGEEQRGDYFAYSANTDGELAHETCM